VELSPRYESILSADVRVLRSMFTVASYAQRRQDLGGHQRILADSLSRSRHADTRLGALHRPALTVDT
jgi:hypothetical protein